MDEKRMRSGDESKTKASLEISFKFGRAKEEKGKE
jgi:hypothetical protein